jgi:hypothetical protein
LPVWHTLATAVVSSDNATISIRDYFTDQIVHDHRAEEKLDGRFRSIFLGDQSPPVIPIEAFGVLPRSPQVDVPGSLSVLR